MNLRSYLAAAFLLATFLPGSMVAQRNELSLSFGGMLSPSVKATPTCEAILVCPATPVTQTINLAFAIEGGYAHRLVDGHVVSLYVEAPFVAAPNNNANQLLSHDFSRFLFAPSLRVKFLPGSGISPFVSGGGGFSHFASGSNSDTTGTFAFGAGVDFKTPLPRLAIRAEARDFVAGRPSTALPDVLSQHLQNVFAGAGVVIHF